jgi:(p)ppGpp synthase/HD superfamily hydrolase
MVITGLRCVVAKGSYGFRDTLLMGLAMRPECIQRAIEFAADAHKDQKRKYSGRPYIEHPLAVARMVGRFNHDNDMIIAALLHDTVEDTPVTLIDIQREFSPGVAALVRDLTDVSGPTDGNRRTRKNKDLLHTAAAQPRAKTVKLMDLVHNSVSIIRHDTDFARVFLDEMHRMLDVLQDASDPQAWVLAERVYVKACLRVHLSK